MSFSDKRFSSKGLLLTKELFCAARWGERKAALFRHFSTFRALRLTGKKVLVKIGLNNKSNLRED